MALSGRTSNGDMSGIRDIGLYRLEIDSLFQGRRWPWWSVALKAPSTILQGVCTFGSWVQRLDGTSGISLNNVEHLIHPHRPTCGGPHQPRAGSACTQRGGAEFTGSAYTPSRMGNPFDQDSVDDDRDGLDFSHHGPWSVLTDTKRCLATKQGP